MFESYDVYGTVGTQPAGSKSPSSWGLFDMHGNLYEWCNDGYARYPSESVTDPTGRGDTAARRVYRGGSWINTAMHCRSARRSSVLPFGRSVYLGFRLAAVQVSQ